MPHVVHLPSTPPVAERPARPTIGPQLVQPRAGAPLPGDGPLAGGIAIVLVVFALAHGNGATPATSGRLRRTSTRSRRCPARRWPRRHARRSFRLLQPRRRSRSRRRILPPTRRNPRSTWCSPRRRSWPPRVSGSSCTRSSPSPLRRSRIRGRRPPGRRLERFCPACQSGSAPQTPRSASARQTPPIFRSRRPPEAGGNGGASAYQAAGAAGPLLSFVVPAGTAANTEIHVTATIPAGFTGPNSPALKAELTLTTG